MECSFPQDFHFCGHGMFVFPRFLSFTPEKSAMVSSGKKNLLLLASMLALLWSQLAPVPDRRFCIMTNETPPCFEAPTTLKARFGFSQHQVECSVYHFQEHARKQTAVSPSCLRMEGLLAFTLWEIAIDASEHLVTRAGGDPSRQLKPKPLKHSGIY